MRIPLLLCPFFVVAVGLPSQTTHVVGAGGFAEIRQALAVAQAGDRILVDPGTYAHFTATVGVTIRAVVPGSVVVHYDTAHAPPGCPFCVNEGPTRFVVPAGQTAHVVGVQFQANDLTGIFAPIHHRVEVQSGRVHFEDCILNSRRYSALRIEQVAQVHLNDTIVGGVGGLGNEGAFGVLVQGGTLTAVGSLIGGGAGFSNSVGAGLQVSGGTVHLSDCVLIGGSGSPFGLTFPALQGVGSAWLHGCVLQGGGCAVVWGGSQPEFDDCTFTSPTNCGIPTGPFPSLVGVEQLDPLLLGSVASQRWHTDPNGPLLLVVGYGLGRTPMPGVIVEPSWIENWFFLGAYAADASGQLTTSFVVPNLPQLTDAELWLGAAGGPGSPLRTSPPVGGVIR